MKGNVFRVDKLMFIPIVIGDSLQPSNEDTEFIDMIQKIQDEKAFYFSYDIDLTKNMQMTVTEFQAQNPSAGMQYNLPH